MNEQTMGKIIAARRKEMGMTQAELAGKMGVTDKAVSKWERDLSYPDITSVPKLAETLDVSVEELMMSTAASAGEGNRGKKGKALPAFRLVAVCVALAMGVAVTVLTRLGDVDVVSGMSMLGIGLALLAVGALPPSK
ncbi:MAG: helix-turn-helix domain-containing protein [Bacillota bacterium]|jgi:transcriptional regulator with XRE-family HTH domain